MVTVAKGDKPIKPRVKRARASVALGTDHPGKRSLKASNLKSKIRNPKSEGCEPDDQHRPDAQIYFRFARLFNFLMLRSIQSSAAW